MAMVEDAEQLHEHIPAPPVPDKFALTTPDERKTLGEIVVWDTLRLTPNPLNPRGSISPDDPSIAELAESIKEHGLIQPIVATPTGTIVAGHRRYYACLVAGVQMVRVVVRELSEREQIEIMLVENVQRRDLNHVQIARGYQALRDRGMSIREIAEKVKWHKASVSKHLDILTLPAEVQAMYERGELALGYIPHLMELKDPAAQIELAAKAAREGWLINEMSSAVNRRKPQKRRAIATSEAEPTPRRYTVILPPYLGKFVELVAAKKGVSPWDYIAEVLDIQIRFEADECGAEYGALSARDFLAVLEAGGAKGDIKRRLESFRDET